MMRAIKNSKYLVTIKYFFPAGKAHEISISAMEETVLQRVKWCLNGAQANKPSYEQQHEVMKQNELFDISMRSY